MEDFDFASSFLGERINPHDHPGYWHSLPLYNTWELFGSANYVEAFYASVVFCRNAIDLSPGDEASVHESVEYAYRLHAGGWVGTGKHLVEQGDKVSFLWTRAIDQTGEHDFEVGPYQAPDFRLHIHNGTTYDLFHIGATWTEALPL